MRSFFAALILYLSSVANSGLAAITSQDLRTLVNERDFRAVDQAMAQAHRESIDGDISYDDLRNLMITLLTTHPDMMKFVSDWPNVLPDSPYALSARALQSYYRGADIRGTGSAGKTHADAHAVFNRILEHGMEDALRAVRLAPDFVPASDAFFLIESASDQVHPSFEDDIINNTLRLTPHLGSLRRIAFFAHSGWLGRRSYGFLWDLCVDWAPYLRDAPGIPPEACFVHLIANTGDMERYWFVSSLVLDIFDHESLEYAFVYRAVRARRTDDADRIEAYLEKVSFDDPWMSQDIQIAHLFSRYFPMKKDSRDKLQTFNDRLQAGVQRQLIHDPFRSSLLEIAMNDYPMIGSQSTRLADTYHEYAIRLAATQPYGAKVWQNIVFSMSGGPIRSGVYRQYEAYINNYIYYSDHSYTSLETDLRRRAVSFGSWWNTFGQHQNHFQPAMSEDEMTRETVCRSARLIRLIETKRRPANEVEAFEAIKNLFPQIENIRRIAQSDPRCVFEVHEPLQNILFEPQQVDMRALLAKELSD